MPRNESERIESNAMTSILRVHNVCIYKRFFLFYSVFCPYFVEEPISDKFSDSVGIGQILLVLVFDSVLFLIYSSHVLFFFHVQTFISVVKSFFTFFAHNKILIDLL